MRNYLTSELRQHLRQQAEIFGLKGKQAYEAIILTKNTIKEELQAELSREQYKPVLDFLRQHSAKIGKDIVVDKLIQKVASRLILRLGIPGGVAVHLATYLVPIILKQISKRVWRNGKVQDFVHTIRRHDRWQSLANLKNTWRQKFNESPTA